jgi:lipoprotein-anchoring transpeptidase ErfK/SrfK
MVTKERVREMTRWTRALSGAIGIFLSMSMVIEPATAAASRNFFDLFRPNSGIELNDARPTNARRTGKVRMSPEFRRQVVPYTGLVPVGTIVVNTGRKFLYLIIGDGKAIRYGIGTARDGFEWSGTHRVSSKREWPGWTPPEAMKRRKPELPDYMPGGVNNPLGARAIYIGSTLYRIHGTNEPWSIGQNVSSGCIRMVNDDVIDLYSRVKIGAKVIVL